MTISRRTLNSLMAGLPLAAALSSALAQSRKDAVVLEIAGGKFRYHKTVSAD